MIVQNGQVGYPSNQATQGPSVIAPAGYGGYPGPAAGYPGNGMGYNQQNHSQPMPAKQPLPKDNDTVNSEAPNDSQTVDGAQTRAPNPPVADSVTPNAPSQSG